MSTRVNGFPDRRFSNERIEREADSLLRLLARAHRIMDQRGYPPVNRPVYEVAA
jgi:hypothetical protein